jgi:threonyl-tRNA synthetase
MAQAVQELFPNVKVTIGPVIEDGFFYDFDKEPPFTEEDLAKIENRMHQISKRNHPIVRSEMSRDAAIELFKKMNEPYKVEIIQDRDDPTFSLYTQGEWMDLCRGPHVPHTGRLKHFKLLKVAGAYWKGDERNKMLSRIYGTAFFTQEEVDEHINRLKEAEKRDHRRIGKDLDLFSISQDVGPGLILWHPRGARIRLGIEDFWRQQHLSNGYDVVYTPHLARASLWEQSGHTGFYKDYMYPRMSVEEQDYLVKPMNCPFHIQIYKSQLRSYRDLPLRWAELGTVYRFERSGVLHGLMRVRGFTQDDAHLFMTPENMHEEVVGVLRFMRQVLKRFGFSEFDIFLSTRPEKYVGSLENWQTATSTLEKALQAEQVEYQVDPGEGVFYGPKIDIKIRDSLKRSWQCSTIQVDFNLPQRFGMEFVDRDGQRKQPIMVHRALLGSIERFFGVLLEHYAGALPFWISPEQIRVLTLSNDQHVYGKKLADQLTALGYRATVDIRNEKLGYKIREAQTQKIPIMAVIGEKEASVSQVSVRMRDGTPHNGLSWEGFIELLKKQENE